MSAVWNREGSSATAYRVPGRIRSVMRAALVLLAIVVSGASTSTSAPAITAVERQRLVAHLEMTAGWLTDEVSGLSPKQLAFHPSPDCVVDPRSARSSRRRRTDLLAGPADGVEGAARPPITQQRRRHPLVRHRPHAREKAIPTEVPKGETRTLAAVLDSLPSVSMPAAGVRADDDRRSARALRGAPGMRRLSVGAAHLHARTASHAADPRDQAEPDVSAPVIRPAWIQRYAAA